MKANKWRKLVALVPAETGWWSEKVGDHFFTDSDELKKIIAALDLPANIFNWQVNRLSSGEKQRLGFARALINKPEALLLDEPSAALDRLTTRKMEKLIKQQAKKGVSIILVTHDENQAKRMANRIFYLKNGKLIPHKDNQSHKEKLNG